MTTDDFDIRDALRPIRLAPAPPAPRIEPRPDGVPASSSRWVPLGFAAALAIGVVALLVAGPRPAPQAADPARLTQRLESIDSRIKTVSPDELRTLLNREVELLRRELALAGN